MQIIDLPYTTGETEEGPLVFLNRSDVEIKYDFSECGKTKWVSILFETIYAFKFTESEYLETIDYIFGLVIIENSDWIQSLIRNFVLSGGYVDDAFGSEMNDVKHYRIYFDDVGLYDVV